MSHGSISNILTRSAAHFEPDDHDLLVAGLSSTTYQQTDDTSARVKGEFWHTHILCNPFYTFYSTRPRKDRLAVLGVLQNTDDLHFRFSAETLDLLQTQFTIPDKWQPRIAELGEVDFSTAQLKTLLDDWFGERNGLAEEQFGGDGRPPIDTTFATIEALGHQTGCQVAQALDEHLTRRHAEHFQGGQTHACPTCQEACDLVEAAKERPLATGDGTITLAEPVFHCPVCQRDFFPSTQSVGD